MTLLGHQYTLRPYQREAVDAAVSFLRGPAKHNAIEVLPTGSGKSLIIANIVAELGAPVLIFQPSKEILEQNLSKLQSYGYHAGVYSASKGRTEISNITFATIGSVVGKTSLFENFRYVIVDECHGINAKEGMYKTFLSALTEAGAKVLGLTATPYRLATNSYGPELRFLTRTRPRVFRELIYYVQNGQLFNHGYLARLEYVTHNGFDRSKLQVNSTGADFTDESVQTCLWASNLPVRLIDITRKEMQTRKNVLVFTRFIEEARYLASRVDGAAIVTGETHKKERARIIEGFKRGDIPVVANVGVLTTGFDYPELETVILARPTRSLGLFYQMAGRGLRPHPQKEYTKIIDMCGNFECFGRIEDLEIIDTGNQKWVVMSKGKQLTNICLGEG
ncbi:MAG: DEAD/DEAH box helicase [Candidatus Omnitrophica bacterium]|nr:DEAD/DEAH box helicase [Candidatus Omnitrophota bacterium]